MRAIGERGGAAMKRKADAAYYHEIGQLGGRASATARRARFAIEAEPTSTSGAPILTEREYPAAGPLTCADAPPPIPQPSCIEERPTPSAREAANDEIVRKSARDTYRTFYGVEPTDEQLDTILQQ